jgi:hypothetical protein
MHSAEIHVIFLVLLLEESYFCPSGFLMDRAMNIGMAWPRCFGMTGVFFSQFKQ